MSILVDQLVEISRQAYKMAGLPTEIVDHLCQGLTKALARVSSLDLPCLTIWEKHFAADAKQTARFVSLDRCNQRDDFWRHSAVADVVDKWHKQVLLVCHDPSWLDRSYQARARALQEGRAIMTAATTATT